MVVVVVVDVDVEVEAAAVGFAGVLSSCCINNKGHLRRISLDPCPCLYSGPMNRYTWNVSTDPDPILPKS